MKIYMVLPFFTVAENRSAMGPIQSRIQPIRFRIGQETFIIDVETVLWYLHHQPDVAQASISHLLSAMSQAIRKYGISAKNRSALNHLIGLSQGAVPICSTNVQCNFIDINIYIRLKFQIFNYFLSFSPNLLMQRLKFIQL